MNIEIDLVGTREDFTPYIDENCNIVLGIRESDEAETLVWITMNSKTARDIGENLVKYGSESERPACRYERKSKDGLNYFATGCMLKLFTLADTPTPAKCEHCGRDVVGGEV